MYSVRVYSQKRSVTDYSMYTGYIKVKSNLTLLLCYCFLKCTNVVMLRRKDKAKDRHLRGNKAEWGSAYLHVGFHSKYLQ